MGRQVHHGLTMGDRMSNRIGALLYALLGGSIINSRRDLSPMLLAPIMREPAPSKAPTKRKRSWNLPHQGKREMARRRRQIALGILTRSNGLEA